MCEAFKTEYEEAEKSRKEYVELLKKLKSFINREVGKKISFSEIPSFSLDSLTN